VHPELTKQLVRQQLEEARKAGVFGPSVVLEEVGYPAFFVRLRAAAGHERLLRFDYTNYDTFPLAAVPVDLITRAPLPTELWMRRDGSAFPTHGATMTQFLCIQGVRDFYTHPGHDPLTTNEPWEKHREDFRIVGVLRLIAGHFSTGKWS
jgi:hypothetical protein